MSSSYLAGIGESIGGILGSLYDAIADPLSAYAGAPDAEIVAGPLSAGARKERAIEELEVDEGAPPRLMVQSHSYHDKVRFVCVDGGRSVWGGMCVYVFWSFLNWKGCLWQPDD
jgi:hypothetical protein